MSDSNYNKTASQLDAQEKKKVAYALNLCVVSVAQIVDYNDRYILSQEYDTILNNLNLQSFIKDEALLDVIRQILDTIPKCEVIAGYKRFVEDEYQQKMKNAVWDCIPNVNVIFNGGSPAQMAITTTMQVGIGYMNYRRNKNQYTVNRDRQEWELQFWAKEQFSGLRLRLFEAAWRLSEKYDFKDEYQLTEKLVERYNDILLDSDPYRRFERLDSYAEHFMAYPPFWYYKGNAAKEIHFSDKYPPEIRKKFKGIALEAFQEFYKFCEVNGQFLKEDVVGAFCCLEHISLLDVNIDSDKEEIYKLLQKADKFAESNHDIWQTSVLVYMALGQLDKAKKFLKRLLNEGNNLSMNGPLLSSIYIKNDEKAEYEILKNQIGKENVEPWPGEEEPETSNTTSTLEKRTQDAEKVVWGAVSVATAIGAIPIPFADMPLLIGAQTAMLAGIAAIFKIDIKKEGLKSLTYAALGIGGAGFIGRAFVNLFKLIPGLGTVIAGGISAVTAGILTRALGMAFIEICKDAKLGKIRVEDITSNDGKTMFSAMVKDWANTYSQNKEKDKEIYTTKTKIQTKEEYEQMLKNYIQSHAKNQNNPIA